MTEETHPSECHPRVMFNGDDTHEGTETYWEMTESTEVLPQRFQVVRKLPTRMSRSAWGCPRPRQEKVGTCSSSPGCVVLWRTIARGGEGWSAAGSCWSTSSCGGGVDAVSNERWRHPPGDRGLAIGGCSGVCPSQPHPRGGGSPPMSPRTTALPGGLVCYVAFAQVPDGHLRPVGTLHLFDSFLSSGGSWRRIRRWLEVRSHQWFALYSNIIKIFRSDGVTDLIDDSVPDMVVPADILYTSSQTLRVR